MYPCFHFLQVCQIIYFFYAQEMNPRVMEMSIKGFLESDAHTFVTELWELLVSAEENDGVPKKFMEEAKEKLKQKIVRTTQFPPRAFPVCLLTLACVDSKSKSSRKNSVLDGQCGRISRTTKK